MSDQPSSTEEDALLQPLLDAGARVTRTHDSTSTGVAVAGVTAATATTYLVESTWTLPEAAAVRLSLGRERLKHKFVKVFKKELQVGDEEFDDLVYITTATLEQTRRLLQDHEDFRDAVEALVHRAGHITVDGTRVVIRTRGRTPAQATPNAELEVRLITPLMQQRPASS